MSLILNPSIAEQFGAENTFDRIMALKGEVFRQLEGRCTQRIILKNKAYFLKQHFGVGWKEIFKNLLQAKLAITSAKNEWQAIQHLQKLNIPTLKAVGYGSRGCNPAARQSFLLTEELTGVISLEDLSKNWHTIPPEPAFKRKLLKNVADIARRMHNSGMNHRDFYICHFLLNPNTEQLYLIDLHRAGIRNQTPVRWVVKDLAGLYFSSKDSGLTSRDLLRFVREYSQQPLRHALNNEGKFWQRIKQRGDKIYQKHQE